METSSQSVRVGIVGVGNCASSFVQGLSYYRNARTNEPVPGLMNSELGGYHVSDVKISAAFDINASKVGRDVAEAIFAAPNNTNRFAKVPPTGVRVHRGRTLDGLGRYLRGEIEESSAPEADFGEVLEATGTNVLVSYLPVGAQRATEWYAERALEARCAFVNCIPVFIASDENWRRRFKERGLPLLGDDIKSQVGATIVHRVLANLFRERGVRLERTYQLNFGGNTDFLNMLERNESTRHSAGRRGHPRRTERFRAVADRSQMGLYPHGGNRVRRCTAQSRAKTGSLGLTELGRRGHRRGTLRKDRARSQDCRAADRSRQLFHEIAAAAVHRSGGA